MLDSWPHMTEWTAAIFGVAGTLLLAGRSRVAGWGFVAYLASNVGWLVFSWEQALWPLFAQQLMFTMSSLYGVWVWLIKPARRVRQGSSQR